MKYRIMGFSHIGNSRENHEDNLLIGKDQFLSKEQVEGMATDRSMVFMEKYIEGQDYAVFVSDGMGGHDNGEVASYEVVSYISSNYEQLLETAISGKDSLAGFFTKLNNDFCKKSIKEYSGTNMGATLCGLVSVGDTFYCINAGDSRMYRFEGNNIIQVSVDNTEGERLIGLGLLSEDEALKFPKRKAIYKYIGWEGDLIPDIYELSNLSGENLFLLCSDGLSDVISEEEILDMIEKKNIRIEDIGRFLVEIALERRPDFGDNITLVLIEEEK